MAEGKAGWGAEVIEMKGDVVDVGAVRSVRDAATMAAGQDNAMTAFTHLREVYSLQYTVKFLEVRRSEVFREWGCVDVPAYSFLTHAMAHVSKLAHQEWKLVMDEGRGWAKPVE